MKKYLFYFLIIVLAGCGGISVINRGVENLYTPPFLAKIEQAKGAYGAGKQENALAILEQIKEETLLPSERAMKKNLIGVIKFSQNDYTQAIFNFNLALTTSSLDEKLTAQIHLNLASSYFKLNDIENTLSTLLLCDFKKLDGKEFINFHKLRFSVAKDLGKKEVALESLFWILSDIKDIVALKSSAQFSEFLTLYFSLDQSQRTRMLKDFSDAKNLVNGYVTYLEVEQLYGQGKRDEARDLADWITDNYEETQEIYNLAEAFLKKLENYASVNPNTIGVILPLTGEKSGFGKRALAGIDHAVRTYNELGNTHEGFRPIVLQIADSEGSATIGKRMVKNLIEQSNVSLIIGGLFSNEALSEYEVSKLYGTFFISLSQIYIEKNQKNHLLIEVPGSVESQLSVIFDEKYLSTFGRRGAIIFPESDRGQSFVNEFWRKANESGAEVVGIHGYNQEGTDQRDSVQKLLGLKYKRERKEELEILRELHDLEGATSIRRIQTLSPQIDFDWVFVPATPREAVQIIPSFGYYDAFNVALVGDPSWRANTIQQESNGFGKLYFIDSNVPKDESDFSNSFEQRFNNKPKLVEIVGYEAFQIGKNIISEGQYKSRSELEVRLQNTKLISGITGDWELKDNVWLKKMNLMSLYRGKINHVGLEEAKAE